MKKINSEMKGWVILLFAELLLLFAALCGFWDENAVYQYDIRDAGLLCGAWSEDGIIIDGSNAWSGEAVKFEKLTLPKGTYRVELEYETDTNMQNMCYVRDVSILYDNLLTNGTHLYSGLHKTGFEMWVRDDTQQAEVIVSYGGQGKMIVKALTIYETDALARTRVFAVVCGGILVNFIYWCIRRHKKEPFSTKTIYIAAGLLGIIVTAAYPLMMNGIISGGDTVFHLMRVEGIKDALLDGQFPARIAPEWQQGNGYASSIFYGETLLYIQALLRMIGFSVLTSYRLFQLFMIIATVLVSYYCFAKIFKEGYIGLLCSGLYSMSIYRIFKTFQTGSQGESCAILFLPLVVYGFYRVFSEDAKAKEYKTAFIPLTLGFTGLVQSHMLSGELVGLFTIMLCLILWKKVFCKETFWELVKTVAATCLLSAWFILPFLDYMVTGDFVIHHVSARTIQDRGLYAAHLFNVFATSGGNSFPQENGMIATEPQTVGVSLMFGLGCFLVLWVAGKGSRVSREEWNAGKIAALFGVLSMVFSLSAFPWNKIQFLHPICQTLVSSLQFPNRFLTIATVMLTLVCGVVGKCLWNECKDTSVQTSGHSAFLGFSIVMGGLVLISSVYLMNDLLNTGDFYRIYNSEGMGNGYVSGGEYLPYGTDTNQLTYQKVIAEENITVYDYQKEGLTTVTECVNSSDREGFMQFPLLYYKGYRAYDEETGEKIPLYDGNNHMVSIAVQAGYEGRIIVEFASPWYWRVAEGISIVSAVLFVIYSYQQKKGSSWCRKGKKA